MPIHAFRTLLYINTIKNEMVTHVINTHRTPRFPLRRTRVLLPFLLLLALPAGRAEGQTFPFQDTTLGVAERVEDLL